MATGFATVFIYGSLLPGHSNNHVVSDYILASRPGRIAGRLVDFGPYPALVRDAEAARSGSCVRGLWIDVEKDGLHVMDTLEEFRGIEECNDYDRVQAVDIDRPEQRGWVYVWGCPRGCPPVEGDYWPAYYKRKIARG
ncbi:gamma-glutamylcyclotransferase [Paenibacillus sp. sptzw28]|uniref:gamma-glutamylcyclotransferase family protein n=1 Tax=Paenibacillus sp. sptzw28 TaxID=715179 RepID=UPI001C6E53A7|nr:gamma-glutamylcyclotransferase family protein [Paenibacillus sp. sptzw28]QYR22911.1 gamma-glutamylcyclotransferase [Paenibacillus sp. sptzw28]